MTLVHVPSTCVPLNDAVVDALCARILHLDFSLATLHDGCACDERDEQLMRRVAIQETLNELAPEKGAGA